MRENAARSYRQTGERASFGVVASDALFGTRKRLFPPRGGERQQAWYRARAQNGRMPASAQRAQ
jgi:hypothetical protein